MISTGFVAIATTHVGAEEAVTEKEVFNGFVKPVIFTEGRISYAGDAPDPWHIYAIDKAILDGLRREHGERVVFDEISTEYEGLCNSWRMLVETGKSDFLTTRINKEAKSFGDNRKERISSEVEYEYQQCKDDKWPFSAPECEIRDQIRQRLEAQEKNEWNEDNEVWAYEKKIDASIVEYLRGIKTDRVYNNMQEIGVSGMAREVCDTIPEVKAFIRKWDDFYVEQDEVDKAFEKHKVDLSDIITNTEK